MSIDNSGIAAMAPAARAFMQRHSIPTDAVREDGRLTLTIDERYRVHVQPGPHHRLALSSDLLALPGGQARRTDDVLLRLARTAAGMLQKHASTLCMDAQQHTLILQQQLPATADANLLEDALADFINALSFWTRLCATESDLLNGDAS